MKGANKVLVILLSLLILTACQSSWDKEVNLSNEEVGQIEVEIDGIKEEIKNQMHTRRSGQAEPMAYVNLARAYVKLGKMKRAERVYKSAIDAGLYSSALHNNLGRLYEEVGAYDKAVEQYQILIDDFVEQNYWYDMTWAYIKAENRLGAEKAFNNWQRTFGKTDVATQEAIKALREKEDA